MNLETETKPSIKINLNPVLEAYCRWVFECPDNNGPITIHRRADIGKHIYSHVQSRNKNIQRPEKNHFVTFILPLTEFGKDELRTRKRYLTVDAWSEEKIRDYIDSDFRAWVRERFEIGYFKNVEQTKIIDTILRGLSLRNNSDFFDMIKKIDYRNRRKKEEIRFESLLTY